MVLEYRKFDLDDDKEKDAFDDLLLRLKPKDVVECKIIERLGMGRPQHMEVHIVYNGDHESLEDG